MISAMQLMLLAVVAMILGGVLTGVMRSYLLARSILDVPKPRSSHTVATPRGAGLGLVLIVFVATGVLWLTGALATAPTLALIGGGVPVALVGWLDDLRSSSVWFRASVHAVAAMIAVWALGGLPFLSTGTTQVPLGPAGSVIAALGIMWITNLYNFMDGIDGIAGTEAVLVAGACGWFLMHAGQPGLAGICAVIAGASLGFLFWNFPPSRVFLGDVWSGTLGYFFGVLALASERAFAVPLLAWLVLLGVFIVDATVTLAVRVLRAEVWHAPHRSHAYQRAVTSGVSHGGVTGVVAAIDAVLIWGVAHAQQDPTFLMPLVISALVVLTGSVLLVYSFARDKR